MTKEELDKQIDKWLKRLETMKPFIDRKVRLNIRREELLQDMKQLQEDYIKALPFKIGDKVIDEDGNVGWLSRIVPHTPSEKYMRATLGLTFFFYMEKEDGTRAKHDVYTHGRPTKL